MIDSSLESTEKQKHVIEKFLASLLFELFDFEVEFQLEQNTSDYYETQLMYFDLLSTKMLIFHWLL